MKCRRTFLVLVAVGIVNGAPISNAGDWPRYRGSNYNGISVEKDWLGKWPGGSPKPVWKKNVGIGFSSMSVAGGRLYTVGNDGKKKGGKDTVYCLDAATGDEVWRYVYDQNLADHYYDGGPGATPTPPPAR